MVIAGSLGISFGVAKNSPIMAEVKPKMKDVINTEFLTNVVTNVQANIEKVLSNNVYDLMDADSRKSLIENGLKLPVNSNITITVDENPTTGFSW